LTEVWYCGVCSELKPNRTLAFSNESKYSKKKNQTWTVSRTDRNALLPLRVSTIDLEDGLCEGFIISNGVDMVGLSSDSMEFEFMPCIVGVLGISLKKFGAYPGVIG